MADQNVESVKKSAAKCVDKYGQDIQKLVKQADDELAKVKAAIAKRFGDVSVNFGTALRNIKIPKDADAKELEKVRVWLEQVVSSKNEPLGKHLRISSDAYLNNGSLTVLSTWFEK